MLFIDQALLKIVKALPDSNKKASLNKKMLPLARSVVDPQSNERTLVLQPQTFIQVMVQTLNINFTDKELYCLLHILVREQPDGASEMLGESAGEKNLSEAQDSQGYIIYRDVYTLVRNYLRKEKIMAQSVGLGLDYQVLTKATFDFLLKIKQALTRQDDRVTDEHKQETVARDFRDAFEKQIKHRRMNGDLSVPLIEFDDFFDALFMKFKIMCPPKETMEHLKLLLCV